METDKLIPYLEAAYKVSINGICNNQIRLGIFKCFSEDFPVCHLWLLQYLLNIFYLPLILLILIYFMSLVLLILIYSYLKTHHLSKRLFLYLGINVADKIFKLDLYEKCDSFLFSAGWMPNLSNNIPSKIFYVEQWVLRILGFPLILILKRVLVKQSVAFIKLVSCHCQVTILGHQGTTFFLICVILYQSTW